MANVQTLARRYVRRRILAERGLTLRRTQSRDTFAEDAAAMMEAAGITPDPWQRAVLRSAAARTLLLVTRQGGKSTTTAGKALHRALYRPGSLVLLLSPSLRQSQELFGKVMGLYNALAMAGAGPVGIERASALRVEFAHGSRIIALPGTEKTVRGFSAVDLLVIDEAARVDSELYYSVRPMLAVSGGDLMALTTPWGKRGWFYEEWTGAEGSETEDEAGGWQRVRITAKECPRISDAFLEEERATLGDWWFRQEYLCEFVDTTDSLFLSHHIEAAFTADVEPLFGAASGGQVAGDGWQAPPPPEPQPLFAP